MCVRVCVGVSACVRACVRECVCVALLQNHSSGESVAFGIAFGDIGSTVQKLLAFSGGKQTECSVHCIGTNKLCNLKKIESN